MADFADIRSKLTSMQTSDVVTRGVQSTTTAPVYDLETVMERNRIAEERARPYKEAKQRFHAAARAHDELVARVVAKYGEPRRAVQTTVVTGDMSRRTAVGAGSVYTYGSTVPVNDPDIMRAYVFRDLEYQRHIEHARLLKIERATAPDMPPEEVAAWTLRALSTVTMAMRALNLAPAAKGTLTAWAGDRGAPVYAYDSSLGPGQLSHEPTDREEQAYRRIGWPLLPANELWMATSLGPNNHGLEYQNGGHGPWAGLYWSVDAGPAHMADQGYAVGFTALTEHARNAGGMGYVAEVDEHRIQLTRQIIRDPALRVLALEWGARWLDWLLSLGTPGEIWTSYFTGWLIRELNTGPGSARGPALPVTLYDFSQIKSDLDIAVTGFVTQIVQLVTLVISAATGNYAGVVSAVAAFGATAADLASSGYSRHTVRWFHNPFSRWFSMPELNLDASNPATGQMLNRLLGTALPNYQRHLGIDFGLKQDVEPAPPPPPMPRTPPGAPPGNFRVDNQPEKKPLSAGLVAAVGGAIVGGALLLRMLRR